MQAQRESLRSRERERARQRRREDDEARAAALEEARAAEAQRQLAREWQLEQAILEREAVRDSDTAAFRAELGAQLRAMGDAAGLAQRQSEAALAALGVSVAACARELGQTKSEVASTHNTGKELAGLLEAQAARVAALERERAAFAQTEEAAKRAQQAEAEWARGRRLASERELCEALTSLRAERAEERAKDLQRAEQLAARQQRDVEALAARVVELQAAAGERDRQLHEKERAQQQNLAAEILQVAQAVRAQEEAAARLHQETLRLAVQSAKTHEELASNANELSALRRVVGALQVYTLATAADLIISFPAACVGGRCRTPPAASRAKNPSATPTRWTGRPR